MAPRKNNGQLTGSARDAQSAKVQQKLSNPQVGQRSGETATVYAPGQAVPTTSNPTKNKPTSLGQVLRIAGGGGGIGLGKLKDILDAGGKNVSGGQVVKRLDKINERLAAKDMTGINLKSGAANFLTRQAEKQGPGMDNFLGLGKSTFGPGKIGQALQGMVGTRATGGYQGKDGFLGEVTPAKARTILPRGMDLMPSGRQTVRGIGKQFGGIPTSTKGPYDGMMNTTGNDQGPPPPPSDGAVQGDTMLPEPPPEEKKVPQMGMSINEAIANWATGFKPARSSRKRAGRGAQTLGGSTRVATPTGGFRGGV